MGLFDEPTYAELAKSNQLLAQIVTLLQGSSNGGALGNPSVLGGATIAVSLPQIQLDILRQGIASEENGYGTPSIASLVITAPAGGTGSFTNTVGTDETWVLLAPLEVNSNVHDALLTITATVDIPTQVLIPSYAFLQDRSFPSTTLRAIRKSLALSIKNGTSVEAELNFITEYAVVPDTYFVGTVLPLLQLGNRVYKNVAAAARTQGLVR